jgi:hypothetical protein
MLGAASLRISTSDPPRARQLHLPPEEMDMASHSGERGADAVSKGADQAKNLAADTAAKVAAGVDAKREQAAGAMDAAADRIGETGERAPEPARRYSRAAKDKLHQTADYVRDHDVEDMERDAAHAVREHAIGTLLVLGVVVVGGAILVAKMLEGEQPESYAEDSPRPMSLKSAASGLGPKGTETLTRIRDAAFSFVMAKAVEAADQAFPGFREHFDRA